MLAMSDTIIRQTLAATANPCASSQSEAILPHKLCSTPSTMLLPVSQFMEPFQPLFQPGYASAHTLQLCVDHCQRPCSGSTAGRHVLSVPALCNAEHIRVPLVQAPHQRIQPLVICTQSRYLNTPPCQAEELCPLRINRDRLTMPRTSASFQVESAKPSRIMQRPTKYIARSVAKKTRRSRPAHCPDSPDLLNYVYTLSLTDPACMGEGALSLHFT